MTMIFEEDDVFNAGADIKVIGVGGCGGNAVEHMIESGIQGVEFICANTDAQDLGKSTAETKIPLGQSLTKGRGAGSKPKVGKEACLENKDQLREILSGTEMLFLTAGMGGGTGTGAGPVVAEIAREMDILTVAVVTKPFAFEGKKRMDEADKGIAELSQYVDSIIIVPNDKLLTELSSDVTMEEAYAESDSVLKGAVQGIADLITHTGKMNVDFADVTTVMSEAGQAMMGTGEASGVNRAEEAADKALNSPLLEGIDLKDAKALLVNITASKDLGLQEYAKANSIANEMASSDAVVIVGVVVDESLGDVMKVTVVATGLGGEVTKRAASRVSKPVFVGESPLSSAPFIEPQEATRTGTDDYFYTPASDDPSSTAAAIIKDDSSVTGQNYDYMDIPPFLRDQSD